ncbi:MAG TPA: MAPEG family protein [Casimicrobiaceae bacterium]|nr:MAPEG family protein [Casimicrobiaceae bacterium]
MKTELVYLVCVTLLTALMWVPYILDRLAVRGIPDTMGYPESPKPQSPWAQRMLKAHSNAVENLVVFATLVLVANAAGVSNNATVLACVVYFWARVVHWLAYTFALPWIRTLAFAAGFFAQMTLAWQLLMR